MAGDIQTIGIVGHGFIGAELYRYLRSEAAAAVGLAPAFVHARRPEALASVADAHRLAALDGPLPNRPALVVEAAHPDITRRHGEAILRQARYMPLSVSALVDDDLTRRLVEVAGAHGTGILLPTGALVGGHSFTATRDMWDAVEITFRKHPANIDFSAIAMDPERITGETVVFEGPVREIASLFPRNVNTMVTCALATVGLDRAVGRLVADPALEGVAIAEVVGRGRDGSEIRTVKRQPMVGVSGTEMFASLLHSIHLGLSRHPPLSIV